MGLTEVVHRNMANPLVETQWEESLPSKQLLATYVSPRDRQPHELPGTPHDPSSLPPQGKVGDPRHRRVSRWWLQMLRLQDTTNILLAEDSFL